MSASIVKDEIHKFLSRETPEVLCIRGKWGVGKSHTWAKQLELSHKAKELKVPRYSYVSLFGVNSLDELKFAIFENVVTLTNGVKKADLETLDAYVSQLGSWRKVTKIAQSIPLVRNFIGTDVTSLVSFMTIRDQLICFDDLERRGQKLDITDILGLTALLREQRNCKVALILNDEQLESDAKRDFKKNLEKVVDVSLVYAPSPAEATSIAITEVDDVSKQISERCMSLGITNIRVIKRITRFAYDIRSMLAEYDQDVLRSAISSIVLFSWSHDQPEEAPPLTFLRDRTPEIFGARVADNLPPSEVSWSTLLEAYGFAWMDDLDLVLMDGICDGYFDDQRLKSAARTVHDKIVATKADGSFEEAWRHYHDSFADDQEEVMDGLYKSFMRNFKYITPTNLNGTVILFKELGRPEQANEMLRHYMENRNESREFFDLDEDLFGGSVTDPDVRSAFQAKAAQVTEMRDLPAMLLSIKDGWDDDVLSALATAPVEEYRKAFKSHFGKDLRRMLANAFQFDRVINASDTMREISRRARNALELIGSESPINARRVSRFGVSSTRTSGGSRGSDPPK